MTKHQFHFYTMAWMDLIEGSSILDIKGAMKMYANIEKFDACIGIQKAINKYPNHKIKFANGGDRKGITTLENKETKFCEKNGIETLWGIGGDFKKNSSSWILKRWSE